MGIPAGDSSGGLAFENFRDSLKACVSSNAYIINSNSLKQFIRVGILHKDMGEEIQEFPVPATIPFEK